MKPTDTELLDALEELINRDRAIVLWTGRGFFPAKIRNSTTSASRCAGLSLLEGKRTLRQALEGLAIGTVAAPAVLSAADGEG